LLGTELCVFANGVRRANPSLGTTFSIESFARDAARAQQDTAEQSEFLRYSLNIWTESDASWLNMSAWDECTADPEYSGPCFAGLDLSSKLDMTSLVTYWPSTGTVKARYWLPEANAGAREKKDGVPYAAWHRSGHLEYTPGDYVDYATIRAEVLADCRKHGVVGLGYDPWNAGTLIEDLREQGVNCVEVPQTTATLHGPMSDIEAMAINKKIRHGGNPILRWNACNVQLRRDVHGNTGLAKGKSRERIDGIAALVCAAAVAAQRVQPQASIILL
jgi:phage terminase large subunit-like protein